MTQTVDVLVEAGKASAGPPIGSTLGPLGVNVKKIVDEINEKTAGLKGMQVPVKIHIKDDKSFSLEIGTPPVSALIKKELGLQKGSGEAGKFRIGDLTKEQVTQIAKAKFNTDDEPHYNQVVGTARSMGVTVGKGKVTAEEIAAYEREKAAKSAEAAPAAGAAPEEGAAPAPEEEKPAKAGAKGKKGGRENK